MYGHGFIESKLIKFFLGKKLSYADSMDLTTLIIFAFYIFLIILVIKFLWWIYKDYKN